MRRETAHHDRESSLGIARFESILDAMQREWSGKLDAATGKTYPEHFRRDVVGRADAGRSVDHPVFAALQTAAEVPELDVPGDLQENVVRLDVPEIEPLYMRDESLG